MRTPFFIAYQWMDDNMAIHFIQMDIFGLFYGTIHNDTL